MLELVVWALAGSVAAWVAAQLAQAWADEDAERPAVQVVPVRTDKNRRRPQG